MCVCVCAFIVYILLCIDITVYLCVLVSLSESHRLSHLVIGFQISARTFLPS